MRFFVIYKTIVLISLWPILFYPSCNLKSGTLCLFIRRCISVEGGILQCFVLIFWFRFVYFCRNWMTLSCTKADLFKMSSFTDSTKVTLKANHHYWVFAAGQRAGWKISFWIKGRHCVPSDWHLVQVGQKPGNVRIAHEARSGLALQLHGESMWASPSEYMSPVTVAVEKSNLTGGTQTTSFGLCTLNFYLLKEQFSLENLQPFLL